MPGGTIEVLMVGGSRDPKVATRYETDKLRVVSFVELVAHARNELEWLVAQLKADA